MYRLLHAFECNTDIISRVNGEVISRVNGKVISRVNGEVISRGGSLVQFSISE